jgi:hypothetical protein
MQYSQAEVVLCEHRRDENRRPTETLVNLNYTTCTGSGRFVSQPVDDACALVSLASGACGQKLLIATVH